jgi:hypothetical protein
MIGTTRLFLLSLCRIPAIKHNDEQNGVEGTEIVGIKKFCIFRVLVSALLSVNRNQILGSLLHGTGIDYHVRKPTDISVLP